MDRRSDAVRLMVFGLTAALRASFSPAVLPSGATQSELTLTADSSAGPSAGTLTVAAVSLDSPSGGTSGVASAQLGVQVCPGYAIPSQCPPFATGGARTISGTIFEYTRDGSRPVQGAALWLWVQTPTRGYTAGRTTTDGAGRYSFGNLPDALILLQAWSAEFDQPCASTVTLSGANATADIEVVSVNAPRLLETPSPPALAGVVYELSAGERKPVAGARLFFEVFMDLVAATTTTDEQGRYTLCQLPAFFTYQEIFAVKSGYRTSSALVSVSGVKELDIEMMRQ